MALQGNLDDFSLPEILQLIAVQQKSGVLKLTSGSDVAVIFFDGGRVVSFTASGLAAFERTFVR